MKVWLHDSLLNWRGWISVIIMSHAYLPSSGSICLSNRTINSAQMLPWRSSEHHSNILNPKRRNEQIGLLQHCLMHGVCRSETKTIWAIVMWTIQSVRVFTVCYCLRRDAKAHEGRGHLLTWAVPSLISVTVWLTATTFNGWKAFIPSALSQAWPVMVSLHVLHGFRDVSSHPWVLTLSICSCQCWECPSVRKGTKEVGTDNQCGQWVWPLAKYLRIAASSSHVHVRKKKKKTPPI